MKGNGMNGAQIIKILKRAQERVARGWIQNRASNALGTQVCAAQAITMAVVAENAGISYPDAINEETEVVGRRLLSAALEQTGQAWGGIPHWNDYPFRTQQEVVDTFDYAIKTAERDFGGPEDAA